MEKKSANKDSDGELCNISELDNQPCPICQEKKMTLTESEREIPYFGVVYIFSMTCTACGFHKADVESQESSEPSRYIIEVSCEEDMKIRVIKSSEATVKIPHIASIEPGVASQGYITNIEGVLNRVKAQIEGVKASAGENDDESEEDEETRKKAKNLLKKIQRIMWGQEKQKIIIEDPTGNSAIISEKAVKEKLK